MVVPRAAASVPRVDIKLMRRDAMARDALFADAAAQPASALAAKGHFSIGIVQAKTEDNVGTLWRSAYQLGASLIFTIAKRYREPPSGGRAGDTLDAAARMPLMEFEDWSHFAKSAPQGATWVAVEMGGTPLDEFVHPANAVYLLGSEDWGLPASVLQACHSVVSLTSERFASYNVATAGSILMYDRVAKQRAAERQAVEKAGGADATRRQRLRSLRRGNFPGRTRRGI